MALDKRKQNRWIQLEPGDWGVDSILQVGQLLTVPEDPLSALLRRQGPFHGTPDLSEQIRTHRTIQFAPDEYLRADSQTQRQDLQSSDSAAALRHLLDPTQVDQREISTTVETIYATTEFITYLIREPEVVDWFNRSDSSDLLFLVTRVRKFQERRSVKGVENLEASAGLVTEGSFYRKHERAKEGEFIESYIVDQIILSESDPPRLLPYLPGTKADLGSNRSILQRILHRSSKKKHETRYASKDDQRESSEASASGSSLRANTDGALRPSSLKSEPPNFIPAAEVIPDSAARPSSVRSEPTESVITPNTIPTSDLLKTSRSSRTPDREKLPQNAQQATSDDPFSRDRSPDHDQEERSTFQDPFLSNTRNISGLDSQKKGNKKPVVIDIFQATPPTSPGLLESLLAPKDQQLPVPSPAEFNSSTEEAEPTKLDSDQNGVESQMSSNPDADQFNHPKNGALADKTSSSVVDDESDDSEAGDQGPEDQRAGDGRVEKSKWRECVFDSVKVNSVSDMQTAQREADKWFKSQDYMGMVNRFLSQYRKTPLVPKYMAKVAILDTGIDLDHPLLNKYKTTNQISSAFCQDFVSGFGSIKDGTGHGTHCAHTILKTCKTARLYVARVFETDEGDEDSVDRIVTAIEWAVKSEVDIISMSFAFTRPQPKIERAIRWAIGQHDVLFFAAASNDRHHYNDPVGFPATMQEVIRVNSCTHNGRQSHFSPNSDEKRENALSTIGEEIGAAFSLTKNDNRRVKRLSGTSMSTAILVGVAALIIEFSKVRGLPKNVISNMETRLHTSAGMKAVMFHCMAGIKPPDPPKYSYIQPWLLFTTERTNDEVVLLINHALNRGL